MQRIGQIISHYWKGILLAAVALFLLLFLLQTLVITVAGVAPAALKSTPLWFYNALLSFATACFGFVALAIYFQHLNQGDAHGIKWLFGEHAKTGELDLIQGRILNQMARGASQQQVLDQLVLYVEQIRDGLICSVLVAEPDGKRLRLVAAPSLPSAYNDAMQDIEVAEGVCSSGTAAFRRERVIIDNIHTHPFWVSKRDIAAHAGLVSCWAEPVLSSKGDVLGTFAIYRREAAKPSTDDLSLIRNAANIASIAIERSRADDELQLASMVYTASSEAIFVTDADNRFVAVNPAFERLTEYSRNEVIGERMATFFADTRDPGLDKEIGAALQTTGAWAGERWSYRKDGREFAARLTLTTTYTDNGEIRNRVGLFSDITEKKLTEDLVWYQANNDMLTNLPNRRLFREKLEQEIKRSTEENTPFALLFIDLDHFKEVNDVLGHDAGDVLLVYAAQRIRECVRESDIVARLGGDEFTVILSEIGESEVVERVSRKIITALGQPFQINTERTFISASVGITLFPRDGNEIEALLRNADQAMYSAKSAGRNTMAWFSPDLYARAQEMHALGNDLRTALANNELQVYFQPIVDLATGYVVKAEALLRWFHPVRGMVSPVAFIPVAEELGLINEIGEWVFRESLRQAKTWPQVNGHDVQVSVNKSPRQFENDESSTEWIRYASELGISTGRVVIEITEGLLIDERSTAAMQLNQLRDAGFKIAIDDFGTGYSSLSYLKKFPIDFVKIDRSFVRDVSTDINDRALCEAIIAIANLLGKQVITEGVETIDQRDFLYNAGGDYGQGYLFAKPLPGKEFVKFITDAEEARLALLSKPQSLSA